MASSSAGTSPWCAIANASPSRTASISVDGERSCRRASAPMAPACARRCFWLCFLRLSFNFSRAARASATTTSLAHMRCFSRAADSPSKSPAATARRKAISCTAMDSPSPMPALMSTIAMATGFEGRCCASLVDPQSVELGLGLSAALPSEKCTPRPFFRFPLLFARSVADVSCSDVISFRSASAAAFLASSALELAPASLSR